MIRDDFDSWGDYHASIFSLTSDGPIRSVLEWVKIFRPSGFSPAELRAASAWLARNAPAQNFYLGQHPQALNERMVQSRREAARHAGTDEWSDRLGTCVKCGGAGMLALPHPRFLDKPGPSPHDPETPHRCGVLCDCALGSWMSQRSPVLTLQAYTALVSDWPERMRRLKEHQEYLKKIGEAARLDSAPGSLEATIDRILSRFPGAETLAGGR